ncbi:MAG: hypothetical protein ACR2N3_12690 [Pyrinomonadaceae bacterium]
MNATNQNEKPNLLHWQIVSLVVGALALIACAVGWFFAPAQFFRSFLLAFVFWIGLAIGCLGVLMMQYVTGGEWGKILRRALEAASLTLPLLAVLFVPILFGLPLLYIWTNPEIVASDTALQQKQIYLNTPFFVVRQIIYFAVWIIFAWLLIRWARAWRRTEEAKYQWRLEHLSAAGMFIVAATISLALVDWVMSLEPHWYSTVYAVGFICGELLAGFAFAIAVIILFAPQLSDAIPAEQFRRLGNLLLTFVMLWAYCAFSQYLLIWSGNLRDEITWYLPRVAGFWGWVALGLIAFHFFVPFFLLLSRDLKENRKTLLGISLFLLLLRFVDVCWLIKPAFAPEIFAVNWMDFAATIGIGGVWLAFFLWLFERQPSLILENGRAEKH